MDLKLSDILWHAANERLSTEDEPSYQGHWPTRVYTCEAAAKAEIALGGNRNATYDDCLCHDFLVSLGVDCESIEQFDEFDPGMERQGARYLWLDFARLVAEEEGL
jgi:hypothetical protein